MAAGGGLAGTDETCILYNGGSKTIEFFKLLVPTLNFGSMYDENINADISQEAYFRKVTFSLVTCACG